jgi:hypothetical protein
VCVASAPEDWSSCASASDADSAKGRTIKATRRSEHNVRRPRDSETDIMENPGSKTPAHALADSAPLRQLGSSSARIRCFHSWCHYKDRSADGQLTLRPLHSNEPAARGRGGRSPNAAWRRRLNSYSRQLSKPSANTRSPGTTPKVALVPPAALAVALITKPAATV